jgi:hypothetical protein
LLATTSICRSSVICRDSPTRSVFSIGGSPLQIDPCAALSQALQRIWQTVQGSPKPLGFADLSAKAVPSRKISIFEWLGCFAG